MNLFKRFWTFLRLQLNESGQVPSSLTDNYDQILSTTLRKLQGRIQDNVSRGNKYLNWMISKGRKKSVDGGERVQVNLMHALNSTADIYSGHGVIDVTPQDGITAAFYPWAELAVSINISRLQERQNSGESRLENLFETKVTQAETSLKELLNNCLVAGRITSGVTGAQGAYSARVGRLDSGASGPAPLPFLIDVTNSRSIPVGNINPNTYSFWRNQATASSLTTWAGMYQEMNQVYNDCSKGAGGVPDFMLGDQRAHEQYWNGLRNQERYIIDDKKTLDILGGSDALKFRGATFIWDEVCPDPDANHSVVDAIGTLTTSTIYFINSPAMEYIVDSKTDFVTTDFVKPENGTYRVAQILWMGCVATNHRRKLGVLSSISRSITS